MNPTKVEPKPETSSITMPPANLTLTPFERYTMLSDSADSPMTFRVIMRFTGEVNREHLSRAYHLAASRQPMLMSRVSEVKPAHWKLVSKPSSLQWCESEQSENERITSAMLPIKLTKEIGLRTVAWCVPDGLLIAMEFHHACCDGQGARQFIAEWLSSYDQLYLGQEPTFGEMLPERLTARHKFLPARPPIELPEGLRNLYATIKGVTARIPKLTSEQIEHQPKRNIVIEMPLSRKLSKDLRAQFKARRLSLNDVSLAAAFQAYKDCFPVKDSRFITILNPVDLRLPSDLKSPACNRVGIAYLRRQSKSWKNYTELLEGLHEEMQYIKTRYVGAEFQHGLSAVAPIPGAMRMIQLLRWFTPTIQFTCLGDTTRGIRYQFREDNGFKLFGNLKLDRISGIAPLIKHVPLSLAACETSNRITFTLQANHWYVTDEDAHDFLNCFLRHVTHSMGLEG